MTWDSVTQWPPNQIFHRGDSVTRDSVTRWQDSTSAGQLSSTDHIDLLPSTVLYCVLLGFPVLYCVLLCYIVIHSSCSASHHLPRWRSCQRGGSLPVMLGNPNYLLLCGYTGRRQTYSFKVSNDIVNKKSKAPLNLPQIWCFSRVVAAFWNFLNLKKDIWSRIIFSSM